MSAVTGFTGNGVNGRFQIGDWRADPGLNTLSLNGSTIRLEPKIMEVLVCLAAHAGEPVSQETILKTVWPDTFVSDDVLTRSVSELRRVLEDDPRSPRFIETIPKRGYRLVAPVTSVNEAMSAQGSSPSPARTSQFRKRVMWFSAAVFPLCGILLGFNVGGVRTRIFGSRPPIRSLAVLPLQSLSTDPSPEYFAEGMTDALITDLAQIGALKVVSRTTIMRYGRPDKPLPQIARELNVDGIVEGTVQRSGEYPGDPYFLGLMAKNYAMAGRFKESVEMYERTDTVAGWNDFAEVLKRADAQGGPRLALEEGLRAGEQYSKTHDDFPLVVMAFTYASLGNKDRAFAWLDKAVEQRSWIIVYLKRDRVWDPLRGDPRFTALLKRVGLPG